MRQWYANFNPCKTPVLLKPFINGHLAVSQFGMRHPKAVSHIVSFLGSNPMGMWAVAHSQTGNMRQVNRCLILSHFLQRDLTTFLKLSNLCTMHYVPSAMDYLPGLCYFCVLCNSPPSFLFATLFAGLPYLYGQPFVCHKPKKDETFQSTACICLINDMRFFAGLQPKQKHG